MAFPPSAVGSITLNPTRVGEVDLRPRTPIGEGAGPEGIARGAGQVAETTPQISFENVLGRLVDGAASADRAAEAQVEALAVGASDDLHGTMISVKEAEISLKLVASVRTKLLDAFHELWRTSV